MEARHLRAALSAAVIVFLAAGLLAAADHRTENFVVSAASPDLAKEVCLEAERFRKELAIEWLGKELPRWPSPCPIRVQAAPRMPAQGATSFVFMAGQPRDFRMEVKGSRERVLDSVLPHEVTHTIFATHFGQPLPRWADEGGCTTVEDPSEMEKMHKNLYQFLTTGRGIAFNQMFAMKEYPQDILPLYAQGFSLAKFFIGQGGKQKYVTYIGRGMQTNNWTSATQEFYGYQSLSDLQSKWLDWVRKGCPALPAASEIAAASATTPVSHSNNTPAGASTELIPVAPQDRTRPANALVPVASAAGGAGGNGSWYVRPEGSAGSVAAEAPTGATTAPPARPEPRSFAEGPPPAANSPLPHRLTGEHLPGGDLKWLAPIGRGAMAAGGTNIEQSVTRPAEPEKPRQIILEWSRGQYVPQGTQEASLPQGQKMLR